MPAESRTSTPIRLRRTGRESLLASATSQYNCGEIRVIQTAGRGDDEGSAGKASTLPTGCVFRAALSQAAMASTTAASAAGSRSLP